MTAMATVRGSGWHRLGGVPDDLLTSDLRVAPPVATPCSQDGCERPKYRDTDGRCKMHADLADYRSGNLRLSTTQASIDLPPIVLDREPPKLERPVPREPSRARGARPRPKHYSWCDCPECKP